MPRNPRPASRGIGGRHAAEYAAYRGNRRLDAATRRVALKYAQACLEVLDTRHNCGLDTRLVATLSHGQWINQAQTLLVCGPTGVGKTWLACAFAQKACRLGKSVLYTRVPRLLEELCIARCDGSHKRRLIALAKLDVLLLDDRMTRRSRWKNTGVTIYWKSWMIAPNARATTITARVPTEHWPEYDGLLMELRVLVD